jgi:Ca2+-binding RTX toxin-like protein
VDLTLAPGSHPSVDLGATIEHFDRVTLRAAPGDSAAWDVALPATVTRDGVSMGTFSTLGQVAVDLGTTASVAVHGTPGPDVVFLGTSTVAVDLGAGDDWVQGNQLEPLPTAGTIDLGSGRDGLSIGSDTSLDVDLKRGLLNGTVGLAGVETSLLAARHVDYRGSAGADAAYAIGCRVLMKGGPGPDTLSYASDDQQVYLPKCGAYRYRIYGQDGRDDLAGWHNADLLVGGRGRDVANGKQGVDTCRAEVVRQCERR